MLRFEPVGQAHAAKAQLGQGQILKLLPDHEDTLLFVNSIYLTPSSLLEVKHFDPKPPKSPGLPAGAFWVCVVCSAKVLERDKRGIGLGGWSHVRFISESGYIIPSK